MILLIYPMIGKKIPRKRGIMIIYFEQLDNDLQFRKHFLNRL